MAAMEKIFNLFGVETDEREEDVEEVAEHQPDNSLKKGEKVMKFTSEIKTKKVSKPQEMPVVQQAGFEVMILEPTRFPDDALKVADQIKSGKVLTLCLEKLELEVARRILDFVEGAAHITEAKVTKVTDGVFNITPKSVRLTSEIPKELDAAEEKVFPTVRNDFRFNEEEEIFIKK